MENSNETELGGKTGGSQPSGVSSRITVDVGNADDSHFQLRESDLIMPGILMTTALTLVVTLILLGISGCASMPPLPPAGPEQKTAVVVANPNCVIACSVEISQSTALENIKNNAGQVTGGTQSQSISQTSTQTVSPTTTVTKDDGVPKP